MREARTLLYVPGHRPDRFGSAVVSGADIVVVDLEDAVPVGAKSDALAAAVAFAQVSRTLVRINAGDAGLREVEELAGCRSLAGLVVPKATPVDVARVHAAAPEVPLLALVESAAGCGAVAEIAGAAGVTRLAIGEVDLAADLRLGSNPDPAILWPIRAAVVVASAASGLPAPIGPVHLGVHDGPALASSTVALRNAGFLSRQVIHPAQVPVVHAALRPSPAELDAAAAQIAGALAADRGVFVDASGRMVDEAVLRSARLIVDLAR